MENDETKRIGEEFARAQGLVGDDEGSERQRILLLSMSMHAGVFTLRDVLTSLEKGEDVDPEKRRMLAGWCDLMGNVADMYAKAGLPEKS